jgi:hypothetical protein
MYLCKKEGNEWILEGVREVNPACYPLSLVKDLKPFNAFGHRRVIAQQRKGPGFRILRGPKRRGHPLKIVRVLSLLPLFRGGSTRRRARASEGKLLNICLGLVFEMRSQGV